MFAEILERLLEWKSAWRAHKSPFGKGEFLLALSLELFHYTNPPAINFFNCLIPQLYDFRDFLLLPLILCFLTRCHMLLWLIPKIAAAVFSTPWASSMALSTMAFSY